MEIDNIASNFNIDEVIIATIDKPTPKPNTSLNNANFPPLPSVYESEDSDFEDLLEDLTKIRTFNGKNSKTICSTSASLSCAMDSRLELGVQTSSEMILKKLVIKNTQLLIQNIASNASQKESNNGLNSWSTSVGSNTLESSLSNHKMLTYCFQSLFENLQDQDPQKIEHILQLWLTLNCPSSKEPFVPNTIPQIVLNSSSVNYLISAMAWTPGLSLTTWCMALQVLTLVCNVNNGKKWFDLSGTANSIVKHEDFVQLFLSLLSGTGPVFNGKVLVSLQYLK